MARFLAALLLGAVFAPLYGQDVVGRAERVDATLADAARADRELRAQLAEDIVAAKESPGREFPAGYRAALIARLEKRSVDQLRASLRLGIINPDALGDSSADLTYTPLPAPCRIIDTRVAGGALSGGAPGPARQFKVAGSAGFDAQGGTIGGCGVPIGATAAVVNFVAVNAQGAGNLRQSAYPNPLPTTGSIINYASVPGLNLANGLLVPICDPTISTCTNDMNVVANGAGTDVVADVLGYAQAFAKNQVRSFSVTASSTTAIDVSAGTCSTSTADSITVVAPVAGSVHLHANVILIVSHTAGQTIAPNIYLAVAPGGCSGQNGLSHSHWVGNSYPTGSFRPSLSLDDTYAVPAGPSTFYINGMNTLTSADTAVIAYAGLVATFEPN